MKKTLRNISLGLLGVYCGLVISWTPEHPARGTVNEVKDRILDFYEENQSVPASLSFITENRIKGEIQRYNISWSPNTLEISSKGNWVYKPSWLYRISFGTLGDRIASSHGNPGHILDHAIPKETEVDQGGSINSKSLRSSP
jgi:hypothetical protein